MSLVPFRIGGIPECCNEMDSIPFFVSLREGIGEVGSACGWRFTGSFHAVEK